jgi:hypothetical protein
VKSPVTLYDCTTADACTDDIDATYTFNVYANDQWTISEDWTPSYSSGNADDATCSFGFSKVTLSKVGTQIAFRTEQHRGEVPHPAGETDCDLDALYAANKDTLACSKLITVKATKVKDL